MKKYAKKYNSLLVLLLALITIHIAWLINFTPPDWKPEAWAQIITAITALVAVISGPVIQLKIVKRQIADNLSTKRHAWIEALRNEFSEILALYSCQEYLKVRINVGESRQAEYEKNFNRINELSVRLQLRLNTKESNHAELIDQMAGLQNLMRDSTNKTDSKEYNYRFQNAIYEIKAKISVILKQEWERVKLGN